MNTSLGTITDIANQMIPLTYFRRNAGDVLDKLADLGQLILMKDGKPVATLTSVSTRIEHSTRWNVFWKVRVSRTFRR